MEALLETSPVGVVVFDARTDALAITNREARGAIRIDLPPRGSGCAGGEQLREKTRRKLGDDPASPSFIRNVRGDVYRMPAPGKV